MTAAHKTPNLPLTGFRIAILATHGFEKSELVEPRSALLERGAECEIISLEPGEIKSWSKGQWSEAMKVDRILRQAHPEDYDALILPGGVLNPDSLRLHEGVTAFVGYFLSSGRPIGAICHGPQILIDTGLLAKRHLTSWPSVKTDLRNAGAIWYDREVVVHDGLVTSRKPADLPAFIAALVQELQTFGGEKGARTDVAKAPRDRKLPLPDDKAITPYI